MVQFSFTCDAILGLVQGRLCLSFLLKETAIFFSTREEYLNLSKKRNGRKKMKGARNVCNLPRFCYFKLHDYITVEIGRAHV